MVITRSDYDSGRLSPLDRESYMLGLSEQPSGNYSSPKFKPFRNRVIPAENSTPRVDAFYSSGKWCDAAERIAKRESGLDWRGWGRNRSRRG